MMTRKVPMTEFEKHLAEKHMNLVPVVIANLTRPCYRLSVSEYEELTQTGYLALCRAAMSYDRKRDFKPYAKVAIRHAIYDYWQSIRIQKEQTCSLDALLADKDSDPMYFISPYAHDTTPQPESEVLSAFPSEYLDKMETAGTPAIQKGITALRLQQQGYKSAEIARLYGVPANHVRAWQSKARKKIKQDRAFLALLA